MANIQQLERALVNADKAGDLDAARKLAVALKVARQQPESMIPDMPLKGAQEGQPETTLMEDIVGAGEAALTTATGATTGALGLIGGTLKGIAEEILTGKFGQGIAEEEAMKGASALTYAPRTEAGKKQVEAIGEVAGELLPATPLTAEMGAIGQAVRAAAPVARAAIPATKVEGMAGAIKREPEPLPTQKLAETAKKAAEGGLGAKEAQKIVAEQAAPDIKTVESAKRLGIDDYLQPDHVTTNQSYRELAQAIKSVPGSQARALEVQGLESISKKADSLIDELGGTQDFSKLNVDVKTRLEAIQADLDKKTGEIFKEINNSIPLNTKVQTTNILDFIGQRINNLGGKENLSTAEKQIFRKLSPKVMEGEEILPTYGLLDDVRKNLTAARVKQSGPFKDADKGLIKKLEMELMKDQKTAIEPFGVSELFDAAQKTVAIRKSVEKDMASLFGKELNNSLVGNLSQSMKKAATGDPTGLIKLMRAVPEEMRPDVMSSGLAVAFNKAAKTGNMSFTNYAQWYEGLLKNKKSYAFIMANLPKEARKKLSDLYRVSKGISLASKERITTGRIQAVREELRGADNLISNIYSVAKRSGAGLAAEAVTTPLGVPGSGLAAGIASALTKGKTDALKAADELISSPEFLSAAKEIGKQKEKPAIKRLSLSKPFLKFIKNAQIAEQIKNNELWLTQAIKSGIVESSIQQEQ